MFQQEEYKIISEQIDGKEVHIRENSQYNNIQADHVCIYEGVRARLFGHVKTQITIKKGAKLFIHGTISGNIINEGGRIYHFEVAPQPPSEKR
ncbi:MAG: hypothetical protein JWO32_1559 [Bacteroidetes bacterium]|nr:hypothetical protein [Bacteroidota bacterium]